MENRLSSLAGVKFGFGWIWHKRTRPTVHAFRYRAFFASVPARLMLEGASGNCLFGINRWALVSLWAKDHGLKETLSLEDMLRESFGKAQIDLDEVRLVAFTRVLGYQFKPISFWLSQQHLLAEVHNTFGERHAYWVDLRNTQTTPKLFHVSPFCAVNGGYQFRVQQTEHLFSAHIDYHDDGAYAQMLDVATEDPNPQGQTKQTVAPLIHTHLSGRLAPCTSGSVFRAMLGYPLFTLAVIARIHLHALALWTKKVPFFSKPLPPAKAISTAQPLNFQPKPHTTPFP